MHDWRGKVLLVTGGAGGMGMAIAHRFLAAGAEIALGDLPGEALAAAGRTIPTALTVAGDLSRVADCERLVTATLQRFGRLDLLVTAAGIWIEGETAATAEAEYDRCLDVNLKGTVFACRYAIPALIENEGQVITIASDAGLQGNAGAAVYCASKGGVVLFSKALALELAPLGVRVNSLCPGDVETPMLAYQAARYGDGDPEGYLDRIRALYPQGARQRFTRPEEVGELAFAVANLPSMTGAAVNLDCGTTAGR